mgnify:CR=1 FL=1
MKEFLLIKENATRVSRLLKEKVDVQIDETLFVLDEEKKLYEAIVAHNFDVNDLDGYINSLNSLINPIIQFFDKVLVMDKDEKIKNNRLALLNELKNKYIMLTDFSKLN